MPIYNPKKRRYSSELYHQVKKKVAQVAGAQLGFIAANAGGAAVGWVKAGQVVDLLRPKEIELNQTKMVVTSFQGQVNPLGKDAAKMKTSCLSQGWHNTNEAYGNVSDPNAVYILHSTYHDTLTIEAIIGACVRKVFKKAAQYVDEARAYLIGNRFDDSGNGMLLQMYLYNPVNSATSALEYEIPDGSGMQSIVSNWANLRAYMAQYMIDGNDAEMFKIVLMYRDTTTVLDVPAWRHAATVNLRNEHITLYCSAKLTFQNRTRGANTNVTETDVVDSQPLVYRCFNFKHADARQLAPDARYYTALPFGFEGAPQVGVRTIRAAQMDTTSVGLGFQNRPDKNIFANCSGAYDKVIEPGAMQTSAISYEHSGNFPTIIKQIKTEFTAFGVASGIRGRAQLFCFEELMRTNSTNHVSIAYEKHTEVGCILKTKPPVPIISMFSVDAEVNNNG